MNVYTDVTRILSNNISQVLNSEISRLQDMLERIYLRIDR